MEFSVDERNFIGMRFYLSVKEAIMNENFSLEHTRNILIEHSDNPNITPDILCFLVDLAIWQGRYTVYDLISNYFHEFQSKNSSAANAFTASEINKDVSSVQIQTHNAVIVYIQRIQYSSIKDEMMKISCGSSCVSLNIKLHTAHDHIIDCSRFLICKNVGCVEFQMHDGEKGTLSLEEAFVEQLYNSQSRPKDYEFHLSGATIIVQTLAYWPFHCLYLDEILPYDSWTGELPLLIGHRGSGQHGGPHGICENTIESFARAGTDGADYVEMDIQLSKDMIPVVYHDFTVAGVGEGIERSIGELSATELRSLLSSDISGHFCTLEEALEKVDIRIGFNIELKYPTFKSSSEDHLSIPGINMYCDRILDVVLSSLANRRRPIFFSSFNPFVCHVMRLKQDRFRVLLLTSAGVSQYRKGVPMAPSAAQVSLGKAVRTAVSCGLDGIVCEAEVFVKAARLIAKIKAETGLAVMTYGSSNNEAISAQLQISHGLDAIIADDVAAIRTVLNSLRST